MAIFDLGHEAAHSPGFIFIETKVAWSGVDIHRAMPNFSLKGTLVKGHTS